MYSGICGLSAKGGNYDGSGNLRMICNMGQEDGETQFSNCEVNVFICETSIDEFRKYECVCLSFNNNNEKNNFSFP